jgi:hypothetical protein
MIPEHNLKPIKRGNTWVWELEFFTDSCFSVAKDVSAWTFTLVAKNASGVTQFTWNNATFVQGLDTNKRTVTLSPATTTGYTAGDFTYELSVVKPEGTFTEMMGFVNVFS